MGTCPVFLFVRKALDGARGVQDRTIGAVGGLAMGARGR